MLGSVLQELGRLLEQVVLVGFALLRVCAGFRFRVLLVEGARDIELVCRLGLVVACRALVVMLGLGVGRSGRLGVRRSGRLGLASDGWLRVRGGRRFGREARACRRRVELQGRGLSRVMLLGRVLVVERLVVLQQVVLRERVVLREWLVVLQLVVVRELVRGASSGS